MLNVKINDAAHDAKLTNTLSEANSMAPSENALLENPLLETQGKNHMNTNTYYVTVMPSLFFVLGVMLIMSMMH